VADLVPDAASAAVPGQVVSSTIRTATLVADGQAVGSPAELEAPRVQPQHQAGIHDIVYPHLWQLHDILFSLFHGQ
jgi:hypothetical protein